MQLPAIDHAHVLGVKVLCLDGNPDAPARGRADWFSAVDIKDKDACLAAAAEHRAVHGLAGVVTVGTDFSTTVAWIAGHLGLPGTPYEAALLAKDKGLMRERFLREGVASPRFGVVEHTWDGCRSAASVASSNPSTAWAPAASVWSPTWPGWTRPSPIPCITPAAPSSRGICRRTRSSASTPSSATAGSSAAGWPTRTIVFPPAFVRDRPYVPQHRAR